MRVNDRRFITFSAGEHKFAVPIEDVREVVSSSGVFPVPGGKKPLLGIIPYREEGVLPVFSLLEILGEPETHGRPLIVIADFDGAPAGFTVQKLGGVITVSGSEEEMRPYEDGLEGYGSSITGVLEKAGEDYVVLEVGQLLSS